MAKKKNAKRRKKSPERRGGRPKGPAKERLSTDIDAAIERRLRVVQRRKKWPWCFAVEAAVRYFLANSPDARRR